MDDLNGLDWSAGSKVNVNKAPATGTGNYYTSLKPSPAVLGSGRSTPLSAQGSGGFKIPATGPKSSTPDSFSNLVSFGSSKHTTLTLQEQQAKLQADKAKKEAENRKQYESQFGNSQFWDGLGSKPQTSSFTPPVTSRASTPAASIVPQSLGNFSTANNGATSGKKLDDEDLFAAFNKDTKVDNSSHYPPPEQTSRKNTPLQSQTLDLSNPEAWGASGETSALGILGDNDDDPFGLGKMERRRVTPVPKLAHADESDDFLGDLGKPVEEVRRQPKPSTTPEAMRQGSNDTRSSDDPWDKAVSELVDMGFSAENSRRALTESGAGLNVQAAVGWLLNDAHRQAKEKASGKSTPNLRPDRDESSRNGSRREESTDSSRKDAVPAWMRAEGRDQSQPRRADSRSPANSEDLSRAAAAVGSNLLKTANSFWKTSQKKVQKAVSEFQQEGGDPSQPKWMRTSTPDIQHTQEQQGMSGTEIRRGRQEGISTNAPDVTDEALMLEADSRPPPRRTKPAVDSRPLSGASSSRDQSPLPPNPSSSRSTPLPRWQQAAPAAPLDAKSRLSKQALEEQSAQAYISPARRKKAIPSPKPTEEPNFLFEDSAMPQSHNKSSHAQRETQSNNRPAPSRSSFASQATTPIVVRPKAPPRSIPSLSPAALAASTQHRLAGTAHFKRGDYASAHDSYSTSLLSLPQSHPITIILFCNRSLTALKTGDPKASVADADTALKLIGPGRGESETIDLGGDGAGEGKKDMKEFWGKALTRKAEALEQMERWKEAYAVWQQAVEAGVGGATAVQGRQRCETALKPKPSAAARPAPKITPKAKPRSALSDLGPTSSQSTEAVNRLRAANAAADKADDEKFALSDSVDARISDWREGRKDNLRALLGGLDKVLWDGSGWKKVGMHELVINGKVKIAYMKAIAKVHPDKLPQDATTEVRMISANVFATLNEAWDKFKTDNGM